MGWARGDGCVVGTPGEMVVFPVGSEGPGMGLLCWETLGGSLGKKEVVMESWRSDSSGWLSSHLSGEENSVKVKVSREARDLPGYSSSCEDR